MKTVLVTGATGFLGRHLVERLTAQREKEAGGLALRLLCRTRPGWLADTSLEIIEGDIREPRAVERAVRGAAEIYHLAGVVSRHPDRAATLYDTYIRGTRNLCESALQHGKPKVVLVSSSGTLAASRQPVMHTEEAAYIVELGARWPYYLSKIYQEKLALAYHAHRQLPIVVVNPSLLLGSGDERLSSTRDVKLFLEGHFLNVPSGGLNFIDVRDAAEALVRAMQSGVPGRRYLVGGHNMTITEFFELAARVSGQRPPRLHLPESWARGGAAVLRWLYRLVGQRYPIDDITIEMGYRFWYFDSARARRELGFQPRPAEETLRDTVAYLRQRAARRTKGS